MPCRNDDDDIGPSKLKQELDQVTAYLCAHCDGLEKSGNTHLMSKDMRDWYQKHKLADQKREEQDRIKRQVDDFDKRAKQDRDAFLDSLKRP